MKSKGGVVISPSDVVIWSTAGRSAVCLVALLSTMGCQEGGSGKDGGMTGRGPEGDAGGLDAGSTTAGGEGGLDAGSNSAGGEDAGGLDAQAPDAGGEAGTVGVPKPCVGAYQGFTDRDIANNLDQPPGKCGNAVDVAALCSKDVNNAARETTLPCYLGLDSGPDLSDEESATIIGCAVEGTGTAEGLKQKLPSMSTGCLTCYAEDVLCMVENCSSVCAADMQSPECMECRETFMCKQAFDLCSGLPSSEELVAPK